jgi:hypothetical protein
MQPFNCQCHEGGEYVDAVSSLTLCCMVRFHIIVSLVSRVLMHCHVLAHGDPRAMVWINVTNDGLMQSSIHREQFTCPARKDWKIIYYLV